MNKKTIALSAVAVIGVAYVAATAYVGSQTEKVVREQVAKANSQLYEHLHAEHSTDYARLNILSFDRDVFKSEAIYQLELRIANERFDLQFEDTYYHGPLPLAGLVAGKWTPALSFARSELLSTSDTQAWFEAAKGQKPLVAETVYHFGGSIDSDVTLASLALPIEDYLIEMAEANLNFRTDGNLRNSSGAGFIPVVQFKSSEGSDTVSFHNISFDGHSEEDDAGKIYNEYSTAIDSVLIDSSVGAQVSLHSIDVSGEGRQVGDLVEGGVSYRIADAQMNQQSFGSFELGTYVKNIDYAVLKEISALSEQAEEDPSVLEPYWRQLLEQNPSLSISPFVWRNTGGETRVELDAQLKGIAEDDPSEKMVDELKINTQVSRDMVMAIFGEEAGFLSAMAEMIFDEKVKELSEQQLIRYENDVASFDFLYSGDEQMVELNGRTMTVDEFALIAGSQVGPLLGM